MISLFDLAAILLFLSALFGWLNHKLVRLPHTVGLLAMGLLASLTLIGLSFAFPGQEMFGSLKSLISSIDFNAVVMNGMLAFLVFAGALNVNLADLRSRAWPILVLALLGTIISTATVGAGLWAAAHLLGHKLSLLWALVFGALISPTDPVAVLSTLKNVNVPIELEAEMKGEALFNDGIGIVLFTILLQLAAGQGNAQPGPSGIILLLLKEAGGGLLLGTATGYLAYTGMRLIDDYPIEIMISLSLVTATYALAEKLGVSGPLAIVAAGLLIGERGPRYAMSERTRTYLFGLWNVLDEILNAVLFLLIGLEVLVLRFAWSSLLAAALAIPIVFIGRLLAVSLPLGIFPRGMVSIHNVPFLTWAGIRGGISVALALSLPDNPVKSALLSATYAVVLFTILVQGTTLPAVARRTVCSSPTTGNGDDSDAGGPSGGGDQPVLPQ